MCKKSKSPPFFLAKCHGLGFANGEKQTFQRLIGPALRYPKKIIIFNFFQLLALFHSTPAKTLNRVVVVVNHEQQT